MNVPIVQVSLFDNEDHDLHYRMGAALEGLRDEGILIIGTGMAVHNLRDYVAILGTDKTMPYVHSPLLSINHHAHSVFTSSLLFLLIPICPSP